MTANPPLRVGRIPYANLLPIFHALRGTRAGAEALFVEGHPSELNVLLRSGGLDLSPNSSIEYAVAPDLYLICPGISIAARTRVMSVLLFSNMPLRDIPPEPIAVTGASDTSVALLEILLGESRGYRNPLERTALPPEKALREYPACLAIGDEALRASVARVAPHVTDLGEWWKRETGKSFVFSLWIASRGAWEGPRKEPLARFAAALLDAKRSVQDSILQGKFPWGGPGWMSAKLREDYWHCLSYDLEEEMEGLSLFYRLAEKYKRIPSAPALQFLEPASSSS
jgi:chorismate dehydratase